MLSDHRTRECLRLRSLFICTVLLLSTPGLFSLSAHGQQALVERGETQCAISVLSLNLHGTRDSQAVLDALRKAGGLERADLMLFQEVVGPRRGALSAVDQLAQALGMQLSFAPGFALRNGDQEGLAVLSRYPILETRVVPLQRNNLLWKSRRRIALAVVVKTPAGNLQAYNLHLDTRVNLKARLEQLRPIAEEAAHYPDPVLVGGDLNTNPFRWGAHTLPLLVAPDQGAGVLNFMNELGYSSAFPRKTPTSRWLRMQLDWLFLRNLQAGKLAVQPISFSDHRALYACLHAVPVPQSTQPVPPAQGRPLEEPEDLGHNLAN
jgi:endonuclease/exonuclease/phosphatase (EEP) superfamily protein YafD